MRISTKVLGSKKLEIRKKELWKLYKSRKKKPQNAVPWNWAKSVEALLKSHMHIFNVTITIVQSLNNVSQTLWKELILQSRCCINLKNYWKKKTCSITHTTQVVLIDSLCCPNTNMQYRTRFVVKHKCPCTRQIPKAAIIIKTQDQIKDVKI
jgi:hypothetical protein